MMELKLRTVHLSEFDETQQEGLKQLSRDMDCDFHWSVYEYVPVPGLWVMIVHEDRYPTPKELKEKLHLRLKQYFEDEVGSEGTRH